jgi:hypothetical protein
MARLPIVTHEKADAKIKDTYNAIDPKHAALVAFTLRVIETLSSHFNHINETDLDLPPAPPL